MVSIFEGKMIDALRNLDMLLPKLLIRKILDKWGS